MIKIKKILAISLVTVTALDGVKNLYADTGDSLNQEPFDKDSQSMAVELAQGAISGVEENGVVRYLGIPFARPPVGELRWRKPVDPEPWQGVRDGSQFGAGCAQIGNFYTSNDPDSFDQFYGSEDCLFLNVWTPAQQSNNQQAANQTKDLPVLVFIHGGSGIHGDSAWGLYNGQRLAKEMNVVFVSINYRLGFFGNAHIDALKNGDPKTDSGSFAVLDQIKALQWVNDNANQFGGDVGNITVMGHSAGCTRIWALLRSPLASDKFNKIVCMSGIPQTGTEEELKTASDELLGKLLLEDGLIADQGELPQYLQSTPAAEVEQFLFGKTTPEIVKAAKGIKQASEGVDGHVITVGNEGPLVNPVPAIISTVRDEAPILLLSRFGNHSYISLWNLIHSDEKLKQSDFFGSLFGLAKFKVASWYSNRVLHSLLDDSIPLLTGQSQPVYMYYFDWDNIPEPWLSLIGVYHGIDVPFLFGTFDQGEPSFADFTWDKTTPDAREELHRNMVEAVSGFIYATDPNHFAPNMDWQLWDEKEKTVMRFE